MNDDNKAAPRFLLDCGDQTLRCAFRDPGTAAYFRRYLRPEEGAAEGPVDLALSPEQLAESRWMVPEDSDPAYLEYMALMLEASRLLLPTGRCLFHGAAFLWRGRAWILSAPSGTGKTTQLIHWRRLLGRELRPINGDKPLLECREDGSVWVRSSPWMGKEGCGLPGQCAPLGGVVLLEQAKENQIEPLTPEQAVCPLFLAFLSDLKTEEEIRCQAAMLDKLLRFAPVWRLRNLGDPASAELSIRTLEAYCAESETGGVDHEI